MLSTVFRGNKASQWGKQKNTKEEKTYEQAQKAKAQTRDTQPRHKIEFLWMYSEQEPKCENAGGQKAAARD